MDNSNKKDVKNITKEKDSEFSFVKEELKEKDSFVENNSINILKENNINDSIKGEDDKKPVIEDKKESPLKEIKKEEVKLKEIAKEVKKETAPKKVEVVVEEKISFDTYFSIMQSLDKNIKPHHKNPMKVFLKSKGFSKLISTKEEFKKALNGY